MNGRARVCLWYDGGIGEAAKFYCETFPDTSLDKAEAAAADNPSVSEGTEFSIEMRIFGIPVLLLNGGPHYPQTEAFSFMIGTDDQAETDRLWNAIVESGGSEGRCGWCRDKWGVSWQIVPRALSEGLSDPHAAGRVQQAMMSMNKIDIARIEAARTGEDA